MPICPSGTEAKPGTAPLIIAGTTLITFLIGARVPPLIPFLSTLEPLILDTGVLCNGDPPPWPEFTAEDLTGLVIGLPSPKVVQAVQHAGWYQFCQCIDATTPAPPVVPPIEGAPSYPPGTTSPCASLHTEFTPDADNLSGTYNLIGSPTAPVGLPVGAKTVRGSGVGINPGTLPDAVSGYVFRITFRSATGTTTGQATMSVIWVNDHWENDGSEFPVPATSTSFYVQVYPNISNWGPFNPGAVVTATYDLYCETPGALASNCCPPDPTLIAKINRLQLTIDQVLEALAPPGALATLTSSPIAGEGTMPLDPAARQVNVQLGELGQNVQLVPYAHPDRVMRAGTVRFGNDFGWRRREHLDNTDCLFPVPPDATVVSWSLSPGTSAMLHQLGAAATRALPLRSATPTSQA